MIEIGKLFAWFFGAAGALCLFLAIMTWWSLGSLSFRATEIERSMLIYGGAAWFGSGVSALFFSWVTIAVANLLEGIESVSRRVPTAYSQNTVAIQSKLEAMASRNDRPKAGNSTIDKPDPRIVRQPKGGFKITTVDGEKSFLTRREAEEFLKLTNLEAN